MNKIIIIIGVFFLCFLSHAQNAPKISDINSPLWTKLYQEELSGDGLWFSYILRYEHERGHADTLYISQVKGLSSYKFSDAQNLNFDSKSRWAYMYRKQDLVLLSLETGKTISIRVPKKFRKIAGGDYLVVLNHDDSFTLYDSQLNLVKQINEVHQFFISPFDDILINYKNGISVMLNHTYFFKVQALPMDKGLIVELQWQSNGNSIAYLLETLMAESSIQRYSLHTYNFETTFSNHLSQDALSLKDTNMNITPWADNILYHPKGNHVLFYLTNPKERQYQDGDPEIWLSTTGKSWGNTAVVDRSLYPILAVWYPETGQYNIIDDGKSEIKLTPNKEFALFFDTSPYEPNYEVSGVANVLAYNLMTGEFKEVLEHRALKILTYGISSKGTYFYYIDDGQWWLYNLYEDRYIHLTKGLDGKWLDSNFDSGGYPEVNGDPVWSNDEKYFIVYDDYDIWFLSPDGSSVKKTNGRTNKIKYRLYNPFKLRLIPNKFIDFRSVTWDIEKPLLVEATNNLDSSGLFVLAPKGEFERKVWGDAHYSGFDHTEDYNTFLLRKQTYSKSPELQLLEKDTVRTLLQTNSIFDTSWRKAEIIKYPYGDGNDSLQSIVYFPKDWNPQKKYPGIVYVYEKLTHDYQKFITPSLFNGTGFNPVNFMEQEYFVIYPDINYTIARPGDSALQSVLASLDYLQTKPWIDKEKIGLIGHSFGGFETAYIISQTDRFAAAVCGAGLTNLVSSYLEFDEIRHRNRMWKFENQQLRMGSSLYDNFENYLNNSAVYHAKKINTPLLLWTGLEDTTVEPAQSMQLHLALRRLNKFNTLIRYPYEGHILQNVKNQKHLTKFIEQWFNLYLK